jgi:hypothetical protein
MGCRDLDGMGLSTARNMGVAYMYGTDGVGQSADMIQSYADSFRFFGLRIAKGTH